MQAEPTSQGKLSKLAPAQKAARLIAERRVRHEPSIAVYTVEGSTGTYHVLASPEGINCPCPATTPLCSHALAVAHMRQTDVLAEIAKIGAGWPLRGVA